MKRGLFTFALLLTAVLLSMPPAFAQPAVSPSSTTVTGAWKGLQGPINVEYTFAETDGALVGSSLYYSVPEKRGDMKGEISALSWNGRSLTFRVKYVQKDGKGPFHGTEAMYDLELKNGALTGTGRNLSLKGEPFPVKLDRTQ